MAFQHIIWVIQNANGVPASGCTVDRSSVARAADVRSNPGSATRLASGEE
jgi:hypothetical protein